ncbi:MAG: CCA tRNA nucleotidyltransferase [Candidatus Doudnabacteria bacterium]|nr:CCA tRNA nucleotidyltransferase [Candidatus Doudnabacteria bacterium]
MNWKPRTSLEKSGMRIVRFLHREGHQTFFVGGFVRDFLLRRKSDNLDVTTSARPEQVEKVLRELDLPVKRVGKQWGTLLTIVKSVPIEITTFRSEGKYSDKRHPDKVNFIKDYREDAKRRDFTINALYFNPIKRELLDPVGGLRDMKARLIRFVGDPKKRIDEDHLRMLRAVRFSAQFGFKLEKNSFAAIKTRAKYIQGIPSERVKSELDKILLSKNRVQGMRLLDQVDLLKFLIPEFEPLKNFYHKSKHYHLEGSQFEHALLVLSGVKVRNINLFYAALLHDIGKPMVGQEAIKDEGQVISTKGHEQASREIFLGFARRLRFSRNDKEAVAWLIEHHGKRSFLKMTPEEQAMYAFNENFNLLLDLWRADLEGNIMTSANEWYRRRSVRVLEIGSRFLRQINNKKTLIDKLAKGELIMKLSDLKPGRALGQKISEVKTQIVLGKIKNVKDLKAILQNGRTAIS